MASTTSTNVNELLPGLESFLRSMLNSTHLDRDHQEIAAMYVSKLDQLTKQTNQQQISTIDDQSLINTDIVSEDESDDFTDEEEEQRKKDLEEQQHQQQQSTPTTSRRSSVSDNQLYHTTRRKSSDGNSQWYIDMPKNAYLEALPTQSSNGLNASLSSKAPSRSSISTPSSSIIADGLLLTYDENHNWIWRYYVLDDFDLICFPADKKSSSTNHIQSDNDSSPLWVSDMTNAKVHTTIIDKVECLCLQIGLAEAIYVRPSDPNQMNIWLKAFRDAASSQKSKDNSKSRSNVKTLSRNARRMFAQFNRKKGQIVSHLLDQMANVTGVDDKTRKHCELRGFLVISLDNITFVTKYCTIVDGIFRIHKSRLSEQTEHELYLNRCKLSFPEERTRDIQFALIDEQVQTIFIRGNNIYSMGRLLNTLAKYVEIMGSSQYVFTSGGSERSTPLIKHRQSTSNSSQPHIYSDVDASSSAINMAQSNEIYSSSSIKSIPANHHSISNVKTTIYHNASKLHDNDSDDRAFILPTRRLINDTNNTSTQQNITCTNETYDRPKSFDNIALISTSIDRNNNHVFVPPQRNDKTKNEDKNNYSKSHSSPKTIPYSNRSKSKLSHSNTSYDPPSSPENTVFCLRSSDSSSSHHRNSRRRPNPLPRRTSTQTTPTDYVNKLANLFTKGFSTPSTSTSVSTSNEHHIGTQTYDTISSQLPSHLNTNYIQSSMTTDNIRPIYKEHSMPKCVYDIPITIERPTKRAITSFDQYQKPNIRNSRSNEPISSYQSNNYQNKEQKEIENEEEEETPYAQGYDNLAKNDGIGKFRFVVPFNHSPTSAFISSKSTIKPINSPVSSSSSTMSSYSTIRQASLSSNKNSTIQFILLFSRQGKLRLQKWYTSQTEKSKKKITRELVATVLSRKPKMSSFLEWKDLKVVYKRYASLYFCCAIEQEDNELLTLETIHRYVELLDKYFGSVCELDIIFNFEKAYFIFDEFILGGEIQETSKKSVLKAINDQDVIQEEELEEKRSVLEDLGLA
ncbi:unnamed protein product [Rotaria sp. Silwood1]|nr:unnamed protein product [Rotaria sp. Silwood1]CAF3323266.1 unnamed protein product [Rotaria sp. Silwood1]CAF4807150.1 unnamed protein product [Rotaria sp. Silwood1]